MPSAMACLFGVQRFWGPAPSECQCSSANTPAHDESAEDVAGVVDAEVDAAEANQHGPREQSPSPGASKKSPQTTRRCPCGLRHARRRSRDDRHGTVPRDALPPNARHWRVRVHGKGASAPPTVSRPVRIPHPFLSRRSPCTGQTARVACASPTFAHMPKSWPRTTASKTTAC